MAGKRKKEGNEGGVAKVRWGFLGAGQMARALVAGMLREGVARADQIVASDPAPAAREEMRERTGVEILGTNRDVVRTSDVIVLAVKPQAMSALLEEIRSVLSARHLVISIAAGVSISSISGGLRGVGRVVRVMPNTPALLGAGASGYCVGPGVSDEEELLVRTMLESVGLCHRLPEPLLDAVTGLSGSGPAYAFLVIEALADGGVRMGLPRDVALSLAAQTVLGAARMVIETGEHPAALRDRVTSPGGTTIAGLHELERGAVRGVLMDAVRQATLRSAELAGQVAGTQASPTREA
jgi:pyrroline-5-carboxylate reductase